MPESTRAATALTGYGDGVLIELYRTERDQAAIRTLVERHHEPVYRRFRRELHSDADADDFSQRLWIQVTRQLDDYRDEGEFPQLLATIATDLIRDHRRRTGTPGHRVAAGPGADRNTDETTGADSDQDGDAARERKGRPGGTHDPDRHLVDDELVDRLVRELIPALPVEQRAAWLLRHESEFWEPGRRLEWAHLAELNGVDVSDAWGLFESARGRLTGGARSSSSTVLDDEEMLVFLVWTQAQRAVKEESFSWDYFGELLGVPVNTMKKRYHEAQQRLMDALEACREA